MSNLTLFALANVLLTVTVVRCVALLLPGADPWRKLSAGLVLFPVIASSAIVVTALFGAISIVPVLGVIALFAPPQAPDGT